MSPRIRNLTKYIAALLTIGFHPRAIQAGARLHRAFFRLFRGAGFLSADTLVQTTRGRITGRARSTPLYYVEEAGGLHVAAAFAGSDVPPDWYLDLVSCREVQVERAGRRSAYRARVLPAEAGQAMWQRLVALDPPFARYQQRIVRRIPIVELTPGFVPPSKASPTGVASPSTSARPAAQVDPDGKSAPAQSA